MTTPINPTSLAMPSGRLAPGPRPVMSLTERLVASTGQHVLLYRRTWKGSIIGHFLTPMLFLVAMGLGIGGLVDARSDGIGGMPYLQFVATGLVAVQAVWLAFGESTYPVMGYLRWNQMYVGMLASPLGVVDVLAGHLIMVVGHLVVATSIFTLVAAAFGAFASWWALLAVPVAVAVGLCFSLWLFALASTAKDDSGFGVVGRVALTPLLLLSGTFFPFENLPGVLQAVGVLTPVWHGVELCRAASAGVFPPGATLLHVGVLLAYLLAGWLLARRQFTRRLVA